MGAVHQPQPRQGTIKSIYGHRLVSVYTFYISFTTLLFDVQTAIAVEVFGVKVENAAIVATSPYTERVVHSVMEDDNAIFSQNIGKWHTRILLVRNLFASRWKYKAFSDRGILATLFSLVMGYLFHTEE